MSRLVNLKLFLGKLVAVNRFVPVRNASNGHDDIQDPVFKLFKLFEGFADLPEIFRGMPVQPNISPNMMDYNLIICKSYKETNAELGRKYNQRQMKQNQPGTDKSTMGMKDNNSAGDSGHDSNSPPHNIYNVEKLKLMAKAYLEVNNDTAQASEKIFQAVRMALAGYADRLAKNTGWWIVPKGATWTYIRYEDLVEQIKLKHPKHRAEIDLGWAQAVILHKVGWCQNNLTVTQVKRKMPNVLKFLDIVGGLNDNDRDLAQTISRFFREDNRKVKKASIENEKQLGIYSQLMDDM